MNPIDDTKPQPLPQEPSQGKPLPAPPYVERKKDKNRGAG